MSKAIDREMFAYFMQLNDAEKQSVVELLKTFMKARKDSSDRVSIEQYNKDIDEAMEQASKGEYTTFEELEKEMGSCKEEAENRNSYPSKKSVKTSLRFHQI